MFFRSLAGSLTATAAVVALAAPSSASAYTHSWGCFTSAYSQCYDNVGQTYNPWQSVTAGTLIGVYELCAKGITAAGNIRSGTQCSFYTANHHTAFSGDTPTTRAYVYWGGGGGGGETIGGQAST